MKKKSTPAPYRTLNLMMLALVVANKAHTEKINPSEIRIRKGGR